MLRNPITISFVFPVSRGRRYHKDFNRKVDKLPLERYCKSGLTILGMLLVIPSCTEPFEFNAEEFENVLIIEAGITDEMKAQEVFLSRSFVADEEVVQERGAMVSIMDDVGVTYQFQEAEPGLYRSTVDFGAVEGREYRLQVSTADGASYSSTMVTLPSKAEIEELRAVRTTNGRGTDGVAILVNSTSQDDGAGFYRYEYEETYRIQSALVGFERLEVVSEDPPTLEVVWNDRNERFCYNGQTSNTISITDTEGFSENRVSDFQVRFIDRGDRIVANRYSILVKQFKQSREAHVFYETLQEFSGIESLFTQTQPGFINGNISSDNDPEDRVLGFFEATAVTSKRIFFDFNDIFTEEDPGTLISECEETLRISRFDPGLFGLITSGNWRFLSTDPLDESQNTYLLVKTRCVDCTVFGTNVRPDFWED